MENNEKNYSDNSVEYNIVRLLDGGFSSQLNTHMNMQTDSTDHPLWCARFLFTNPTAIINTHRDYIRAGAEIMITNTYQASIDGFQKYFDLSPVESFRLIKDAVSFVRRAIALERICSNKPLDTVKIAGSVGSYGASLNDGSEYNGEYLKQVPIEEIKKWHKPRISALVEAGVDYLAIETIPGAVEAEAILEILKEFPQQKAWISFTCKDEKHTAAGDEIGQVSKKLWNAGKDQLVAIGVNCLHPSLVASLIKTIRAADGQCSIPTIAYPNNGEKYDTENKCWVKICGSPSVDSYIEEWLKCGVSIIGGCCRTTADDIRKFKEKVVEFNNRKSKPDTEIEQQ